MVLQCSLADTICGDLLTWNCPVFRYWFFTDEILTLTDTEPVKNMKENFSIPPERHLGEQILVHRSTYSRSLSSLGAD